MNAATDDKIASNSALRQGLLKRRQATDREKLGAFVIGCALLAFGYFASFPGVYGAYVRGKVLALGIILTAGLLWGLYRSSRRR
jgi:hypothetical protein